MIFGNNYIRIENSKQHWSIEFNALDALKEVQLQDSGIRVAYSNDWIKSKKRQNSTNGAQRFTNDVNDDSLNIIHKDDWTYTTRYKGTESSPESKFRLDNDQKLPLDKLAVHDKILFYDDMILFEDELADNGISIFNVKIRVMNERLLLLSRFFLRVDDVLVRVYDTRIYVEFDENVVIRESKEFEGKYQDVLAKHRLSQSHDPKAALRDSNWVAQNTPMIKRQCEIIQF